VKRPVLIACLLLVVLTLGVFYPVARFDFVHWDDDAYVTDNPCVQKGLTLENVMWAFTTDYFGYYYPLTWLSHMTDCQLFGLRAGGHHATSVVIHVLNVLLLFGALAVMTGSVWRSTIVAALFAVHPQHVESVAWIAERKDVLSTFFFLLAVLAYAHYARGPSARRYVAVFAAFVLGLLAKPMIVTLPVLLLLLDYWPLARWPAPHRDRAWRLVREKLPLAALVPVFVLVTYVAQGKINAVASVAALPMGQRFGNALISYVDYIVRMFAPVHLTAFYAHPRGGISYQTAGAAAVLLAAATAAAVYFGSRRRYLAVGWIWYLITLAPVIGIIQVGDQASADRYTYLALIGPFVILVWGAAELAGGWLIRHRAVGAAISSIAVAALAVRAHDQVYQWKNSATLFTSMVRISPDAAVAHYNLGKVQDAAGDTAAAAASYERAVELDPSRAQAWTNLGIDRNKLGDKEGALKAFLRSAELKPEVASTHFDIGLEYETLERFDDALAAYGEALRLDPDIKGIHAALSRVYSRLGRKNEAVAAGLEALKRQPDDVALSVNLGRLCEDVAMWPEAQLAFEQATRLEPGNAEAWAYLALAYQNDNKLDKAVAAYRAAIHAKPDLVICRFNLGVLSLKAGDVPSAAEQAAALQPLDPALSQALTKLIKAQPAGSKR
jgi:tetratricopeptide (TPR) repeat protein